MSLAIEILFQKYFLPNYVLKVTSGTGELQSEETNELWQSLAIHIGPSVDGSDKNTVVIEETGPQRIEWREMIEGTRRDLLCQFHEQIFGFPGFNQSSDNEIIIQCTSWYPHLATYLLTAQARHLYALLHPELESYSYRMRQIFQYITQCLPYADPTDQNLLALRALLYLSSEPTNPLWRPPSGFRCSVVEFLKVLSNIL